MPRRSRRRTVLAALALTAALAGPVSVATPAAHAAAPARAARGGISADQEAERQLVNETRGNNDRRGLAMNALMAQRAQNWAEHLADCHCLEHRNPPYGAPAGWQAAAENVGRGWSLEQIHRAFLNSPPHRENMLTRRFTHIGTGVARNPNGEIFVVQGYLDLTA